MAAEPALHPR